MKFQSLRLLLSWPPPKYLSPANAALLVLLLGPLPLSIIYLYMRWIHHPDTQFRGLFEFYTVTIGDFCVLPISWAIMSKYYSSSEYLANLHQEKPTRRIWTLLVSIVFASITTLTGMIGTRRDWTLPRVGYTNFAGIYHTFFMAIMIASYISYIQDHWYVSRTSKQSSITLELLPTFYWMVLNLLTAFAFLLWLDRVFDLKANFLGIEPLQQISWLIFIIINIYITIKCNQKPFGHTIMWFAIQLTYWGILFLISSLYTSK